MKDLTIDELVGWAEKPAPGWGKEDGHQLRQYLSTTSGRKIIRHLIDKNTELDTIKGVDFGDPESVELAKHKQSIIKANEMILEMFVELVNTKEEESTDGD